MLYKESKYHMDLKRLIKCHIETSSVLFLEFHICDIDDSQL